ncbi:MAG: YcxB family protein [Thermoplasmatota archaeon]
MMVGRHNNGSGERVEIEVFATKEDFIQFNIDTTNASKTIKKQKTKTFLNSVVGLIISILLMLLFLVMMKYGYDMTFLLPFALLLFILSATMMFFPFIQRRVTKKLARSIVDEGSIKSYLGKNTFRFKDDYLERRNETRLERVKWSAFVKVVETREHVYIHDTNLSAFILPKRDLSKDQYKEMMKFLAGKIDKFEKVDEG